MVSNKVHGASKVTILIFAAIVFTAIYAGYRITPFFYYYYELQNQLDQLVQIAPLEKETYIQRRVMEMVKRYEIPIDEKDVKVERTDKGLSISIPYTEILDIEWRGHYFDLHEFKFHAKAQTK